MNRLLTMICCNFEKGLVFSGLNLALAVFNLLPVGRLDGGRALHCTMALLAGPGAADWLGSRLDWLCTVGALAAGLFLAGVKGNFTLLLVAFWLVALSFRQNFCWFQQNKPCQRGRKKVQ